MTVEQILGKLVSFPFLGGDANMAIINWVKGYIESFGIEVSLVPNQEKTKASLHCRIGPAVDGGVILSGHTDVVPVEGQNWDTDPFHLIAKDDGNLYARGSCDMKGFLATCLKVLPEMIKANLQRPIYFAFSYDEEIGCLSARDLVKHLKETYSEKPKYAIIGEPSLLQPIVGQKAIQVLETRVYATAGHSSGIKQKVSAVHEAVRLVLWLENKMNTLIEANHIDERFQPPHTTLHVGQFKGGIAANVIADKACFSWDLRTIPQDSIDEIIAEFKLHCEKREKELTVKFPDFKIETVTTHPVVPHLDTQAKEDIVKLIKKISGNVVMNTVSFASEAGIFFQNGFETIICGPGSINQAHQANEFIAKEQLQKGMELLQNLVNEMSLPQTEISKNK